MTDMLMVTTTVRMLYGVHSHTSDLWPAVSLNSVFMVSSTSLQHGLIASTATGYQAHDAPVFGRVQLFDARGQLDLGSAGVQVVGYDGAIAARGLGNLASVAGFLFKRAQDGTFWHLSDREDVSNS